MANNKVIANSGNPFTAATDEIGGIDYGKVKLFSSTEDATAGIGDDDKGTARALWVANKTDLLIPTTPVNSAGLTIATTAYAIGDVLGTGWTVPNAVRAAGGYGRIETITLIDAGDVTDVVHLYFAQESITFGTDNSPPSVSDADAKKILGRLSIALVDLGGCRVGALDSISFPYVCNGSTSLFVYALTGTANAIFTAVTDLALRVGVVRD